MVVGSIRLTCLAWHRHRFSWRSSATSLPPPMESSDEFSRLASTPVCSKAAEPGSKNRRLNTSTLLRHPSSSGRCNILIDAGKFFSHIALQWFPSFGIRTIDVVITHLHADATGGL